MQRPGEQATIEQREAYYQWARAELQAAARHYAGMWQYAGEKGQPELDLEKAARNFVWAEENTYYAIADRIKENVRTPTESDPE